MNFNFSAEELAVGAITSPWATQRLRVSNTNACCGSKSFSSQGLGFWGNTTPARIYELTTPPFTSAVDNLNLVTVGFSYRVYAPIYPGYNNVPPATPQPNWYYEVILRETNGATVTDTNISGGTVTGSGNTKIPGTNTDGCAAFFENVNLTLYSGRSYRLIIRFWTDNPNTSTQNFVTIDCISSQSNVLSSEANENLDGLSEPSYTKTTGTGTVDSNGALKADISLAKSAQSAVSCGTDDTQSSATPNCARGSVKGIYFVEKYNKSTGDFVSVTEETFTINYGSSSSTPLSKTAVVFEDPTYIYKHLVGYQVWSTANAWDLNMAYEEFTPPSKPAATLGISYSAGNYIATLSNPITADINISGVSVIGSTTNYCGDEYQTDSLSSLDVPAGEIQNSVLTGGITDATHFKVNNGAWVNGNYVTNNSTTTINGHTVTVEIANLSCSEYDQMPPEE
jgi:hypothetical protein